MHQLRLKLAKFYSFALKHFATLGNKINCKQESFLYASYYFNFSAVGLRVKHHLSGIIKLLSQALCENAKIDQLD